jgi:coenzyme F420-reducing hydrogenase alpha subunit
MGTQKITIEPVTRIEGHAKVTIHLDKSTRSITLICISMSFGFEVL